MTTNEKLATKLWYQVVHILHPTCVFAGSQFALEDPCDGAIEAHHVWGRSSRAWKWRACYGVGLCAHHHRLSTKASPHGSPLGFWNEWLILNPKRVQLLRESRVACMLEEPTEAISRLQEQLKQLAQG